MYLLIDPLKYVLEPPLSKITLRYAWCTTNTTQSTPTVFAPFGGSAYKLMANRLKAVSDKLNFESQNAFVGDRKFFYSDLTAN